MRDEQFQDYINKLIQNSPDSVELDFRATFDDDKKLSSDQLTSLADVLKVNTTLEILDLSLNDNTGAEGARKLACVLEINTKLRMLNLWRNGIGAAGAEALAGALKVNNTLKSLYLTSNATGMGTTMLGEALTVNTRWKNLAFVVIKLRMMESKRLLRLSKSIPD